MMNKRNLACMAACKVLKRMGESHPMAHPFFDDMAQDAFLRLFTMKSEQAQKGSAYCFRAAYYAALESFFILSFGYSDHNGKEKMILAIPLLFDPPVFDEEDQEILPFFEREETAEALVNLFLEIRKKRGKRGLKSAVRDANICLLATRGMANADIADILGISAENVKVYRQQIRRKLRRILEENEK